MSKVTLRNAVPADAQAIAEVHVAAWQAAYVPFMGEAYLNSLSVTIRQQRWSKILQNEGRSRTVVAESDGQVRGFVSFGPSRDEDLDGSAAELMALYVHPDNWQQGLGGKLIDHVIDAVRLAGYQCLYLWVIKGNQRAVRVYQHCGFVDTGVEKSERVHDDQVVDEVRYCLGLI